MGKKSQLKEIIIKAKMVMRRGRKVLEEEVCLRKSCWMRMILFRMVRIILIIFFFHRRSRK